MERVYEEEDYAAVRQYILSSAIFPDGTKCGILVFDDNFYHMCLNDREKKIVLCMFEGVVESFDKEVFEKILEISKSFNEIDHHYIEFYNSDILPTSYCSNYNELKLYDIWI